MVQAEYAALAQYARLESARADLYPSFSLSGALGSSSTTLGGGSVTDLFSWDQRLLSAGLGVTLPLFNRGRLVAQVDLQDAGFIEAVVAYEKVVLDAQREVLTPSSRIRAHGGPQPTQPTVWTPDVGRPPWPSVVWTPAPGFAPNA